LKVAYYADTIAHNALWQYDHFLRVIAVSWMATFTNLFKTTYCVIQPKLPDNSLS